MSNDRTLYKIHNEIGKKTSITLEKWIADILQESLPDVHAWVQNAYVIVTRKKPELSRRQKGDLVRRMSVREAEKSPRYNELIADLF